MSGGEAAWSIGPQASLPEMVASRVVEAIRSGVLKAGDRIVEAELAGKLGVSRGSLREALKALEAHHLVERRRNRGTFVTQPDVSEAVQMIMVRAALEGLAARIVAAERRPEAMAALEAQHAQMQDDARAGRVSAWREHDWQFHESVCRATGNVFLERAWASIGNLVRLFLHAHPSYEHEADEVLRHHEQLIAALRSGDADRADRTFQRVILQSGLRRLGMATPPGFGGLLDG
jgi:DNA-binding GntR family transcriptional regulator